MTSKGLFVQVNVFPFAQKESVKSAFPFQWMAPLYLFARENILINRGRPFSATARKNYSSAAAG